MFWRRWSLARAGEDRARRFLEANGYQILGQRVRLAGVEIDLVARGPAIVALVEVKTRRTTAFGRPAEGVDAGKARRLARAAMHVPRAWPQLSGLRTRLDVIEVLWPDDGEPTIAHLTDAVDDPDRD